VINESSDFDSAPPLLCAGKRQQPTQGRDAAAPRAAAIRSQVGTYPGSAPSHNYTVFARNSAENSH